MQLRWSHAFLQVGDMPKMLDFYTGVLGFEITDRGELAGNELVFLSQVETDHHQLGFSATRKDMSHSNNVAHFAFRVDDLATVKTFYDTLSSDERVSNIAPVNHGNAWSVYFNDPEGNGIEIFCDTPWHVAQPQGRAWDPSKPIEEIVADTESAFSDAAGFGPIADYYQSCANELDQREGRVHE